MSRKETSILPEALAKNDYFRNRAPSRSPTRRPPRKSQLADSDAKAFKWSSEAQEKNDKKVNGVAVNGTSNGHRDRLPQINGTVTNSATSDRSNDKSQNSEAAMLGEVTIAFIDYSENRNLIKRAKDQMRNVKIVQFIGQGKGSSRMNHEFWMQNETAAKFPVQQQSISSRTPLNFSFHLDGQFFHRMSVCCLNKLRTTHQIIGSKLTHFKVVECTNVVLCYRCKGHEFMLQSFKKSPLAATYGGRSVSMPRRGLNDTTELSAADTSNTSSSDKRGALRDRLNGDSASFGVKRSRSISRSRMNGRDNSRPAPLQRNATKLLIGKGKGTLKYGHALGSFPVKSPHELLDSGREKLLENYCEDRLSPELDEEELQALGKSNGNVQTTTTGGDRKTSRSRKPSAAVRRLSKEKERSPPRSINDVGTRVEYNGGKRVGEEEGEVNVEENYQNVLMAGGDIGETKEGEGASQGNRIEDRTQTGGERQTSAASSIGSKTVSRPNSATEIPHVEETYQNELLSTGGLEDNDTEEATETFIRSTSQNEDTKVPQPTETMVRSVDNDDEKKPTETFVRTDTETEPDIGETSASTLQKTQPIRDRPDSSKTNVDSAEDMIELAHDKPASNAPAPEESVMPADSIIHTDEQHPQSQHVHREEEKPVVVPASDISLANVPSLAKEDPVAFAWPDSHQGNKATPSAPGTPREETVEKPAGFVWPDAAEGAPGKVRSARPSRHVSVEILDDRQNSQNPEGEEEDVPMKPVPLDEMALHRGIVPSGTEIRTTTVRDEVPLDEIGLKRKKSMTEGATESRRGSRATPIQRMKSGNSHASSQDVSIEESRPDSTPQNAEEFVQQLGFSRPSSSISEPQGRTTPATFEKHHTGNVPEGIYHDNPLPTHNAAVEPAEKRNSDDSVSSVTSPGKRQRPKLNHIGASQDSTGSSGTPREHIKPPSSPHTAAEMIDQLGFAPDGDK